jgi:hypothetical protein
MLAFSLFLPLYKVIITTCISSSSFIPKPIHPLHTLQHLPETLQKYCSTGIFIYMWSYTLLHTSLYTSLNKFITHKSKSSHKFSLRQRSSSSFRRQHLFLLIYILLNISIMAAIHHIMPLHFLLVCQPSWAFSVSTIHCIHLQHSITILSNNPFLHLQIL